jgi:hypothetical protein
LVLSGDGAIVTQPQPNITHRPLNRENSGKFVDPRPQTAFLGIAHAELAADLAHVDGLAS